MIQDLRRVVATYVSQAVFILTLGQVHVDPTGQSHHNRAEKPPMTAPESPSTGDSDNEQLDGRSNGDEAEPDAAR